MLSHVRDKSRQAIGDRIRLTRAALGMKQAEFAARAGLQANTVSQLEHGKFRASLQTATALVETYDLTLNWIYFGDPAGLRAHLWDAIKALRLSRDLGSERATAR